jgi:hypothetical protein
VLLVVLRVAGAAPADTPSEVSLNPDYYDDDLFVPASSEENFDVFDWQLCKVRVRCFKGKTSHAKNEKNHFKGFWIGFSDPVHRLVKICKDHNVPKTDTVSETFRSFQNKKLWAESRNPVITTDKSTSNITLLP